MMINALCEATCPQHLRHAVLLWCAIALSACTDPLEYHSNPSSAKDVQIQGKSQPAIVNMPDNLMESRINESAVPDVVLQVAVQLENPVETIPASVEILQPGQWSVLFSVPPNRTFMVSLEWLWKGLPIAKSSSAFPALNANSSLEFDIGAASLDVAFDHDDDGVSNIDELNNGSDPFFNESVGDNGGQQAQQPTTTENEQSVSTDTEEPATTDAEEPTLTENETPEQTETQEPVMTDNSNGSDSDGDGITDGQDNCPTISNTDQQDTNQSGIGDACETSTGSLNTGTDFISIAGQAPWRNGVSWPRVTEGEVAEFVFTVQETRGGIVNLDSIELWAIDSSNNYGIIFENNTGTSIEPTAFLLKKWSDISFAPFGVQVFRHSMTIDAANGFFSEGRMENNYEHRHDVAMISRDRFSPEQYTVLVSPPTQEDGSGSRYGTNLYVDYR